MKIFLAADHGGVELKKKMKEYLTKNSEYEVFDLGAEEVVPDDDYVDYAVKLAKQLEVNEGARGILICRNGMGMCIVANRFSRVRCGFGFENEAVLRARTDDDINCLALPADYLRIQDVEEITETFLKTEFSKQERYLRRLEKLSKI